VHITRAPQIHREVADVAGQHNLALAVENVRDNLPLRDDGLHATLVEELRKLFG
jgi:hypothetical protein